MYDPAISVSISKIQDQRSTQVEEMKLIVLILKKK
jgi:hypothetical protein